MWRWVLAWMQYLIHVSQILISWYFIVIDWWYPRHVFNGVKMLRWRILLVQVSQVLPILEFGCVLQDSALALRKVLLFFEVLTSTTFLLLAQASLTGRIRALSTLLDNHGMLWRWIPHHRCVFLDSAASRTLRLAWFCFSVCCSRPSHRVKLHINWLSRCVVEA